MGQPQPDGGLVGRTLGAYRILESLGSGGMGQVYLAEHATLSRRVALKVLPPEMASHPEKIARFEREAKAVASLSHPGIVTLYSIEEADGIRFLTMEHVEGETLSKQIPPRGFAMERLLSLAIALADAVSAAHRQGILHRDLKPENIMLPADGRLKVLDFGLAKLRYDAEEGDHTTRETQSVTQDGRIVGTVAYMSPEQAQGLPVDHRSDIFTLGILLYEMATGERPFRGNTNLSVLSSILKDSPRPVSELRDDIPKPLARMIQRALEKRPEDRYQSASDLRRDLEDLKRDVDSGELVLGTTAGRTRLVARARSRRRWAMPAAIGAALVVLAAMAALFLRGQAPATAEDGRRSVAVFYFDNLTADPQLDWLRTGLTDMLVTNLSQSPGLRVLGTSRLYQLLDETGHRDDRTMSAPIVESVARKAQATTALVGSFVRAGSQIRIQATLQDPKSGEVIASERVEGDAESGLFALVDELTGRVRKRLETTPRARMVDRRHVSWKEKKLEEVTTTSVEAWKAYTEGSRLHERLQEKEAQPFFEKAVEADPGFAMAIAKLSIVHGNLGNTDKARAYAAKAVEKSGNLPPGERFYIEGRHYSLDPATIEKAIEAYQKAVDEAPEQTAARNNLAQLLLEMQRYPEALVHLEDLRRRGMTFPASYLSLAQAYVVTGRPDKAREALAEYAAEHPDRAASFENLAYFELTQGRTEAALAAFDKAAALHPDDSMKIEMGRFTAHALRDEWPEAEAAAKRLVASDDPRQQWEGGASLAMASLYRGDVGEARRLAAEGAKTGRNAEERVGARLFRAGLESDLGRDREALAEAEGVLREKVKEPKLLAGGHAMKAISLARLGRKAEAEKSLAQVDAFLATIPRTLAEPQRLHLEGEIALARGDHAAARAALEKAARVAPMEGIKMDSGPVEIRYALARAALEAGDSDAAREALRAVVDAGPARVMTPLPYVRSLALLAALEEKAGRTADARKLYERYLGYWKDGQIDRAEVARAGQRLAALGPRPAA
ncbi:MAG TPA: protein kinase [Vicinamibacteria bacterium]|nr:protein kinase [Vicinamibacteria bacterium]